MFKIQYESKEKLTKKISEHIWNYIHASNIQHVGKWKFVFKIRGKERMRVEVLLWLKFNLEHLHTIEINIKHTYYHPFMKNFGLLTLSWVMDSIYFANVKKKQNISGTPVLSQFSCTDTPLVNFGKNHLLHTGRKHF